VALTSDEGALALDVARFLVAIVVLSAVSVTDIRWRRAPNVAWYVAAAIGTAILAVDLWMTGGGGAAVALAFPVAAIFVVVVTGGELLPVMPDDEPDPDRELTPREARIYIADLAVSAVLVISSLAVMWASASTLEDDGPVWAVASSAATMLLAVLFYAARLLHGGGDAKALMALAVLFPTYPALGGLPLLDMPAGMDLLFPFALTVLIDAAVLVVLSPLVFLAISARRGPVRLPEALFGYPVAPDGVDASREWLMYELDEAGQLRRHLWPRRSKAATEARARALDRLKAQGEPRVYVSPKVPFMVPMLAGLLVAAFAGNLVLGAVLALAGL
jgi:hypothetical protein